ncbi:MAG: VOC family protein [Egibacteraceae bacterium]
MTQQADFETRRAELAAQYLMPEAERPSSTARGVHHLALICSDVERTIRFYQGVLGFPLIELLENRDYPGSTHFFFDIGNNNLLGFFDFPGLGLGQAEEAIGGVQHIAISVDPQRFEELKGRLDEHGITYLGPDRGVEESMYFRDPDGIQIELTRDPLYEMLGGRLGQDR